MNATFFTLLACLFLLTVTSSCYRMPTEDDYSLIPSTNNPDFTRESSKATMPGIGY